jgi:hypothetical protein
MIAAAAPNGGSATAQMGEGASRISVTADIFGSDARDGARRLHNE